MFVIPFHAITLDDVAQVGGKNASLGEMVRALSPLGIQVPDGFATTADAFRETLRANNLEATLAPLLAGLDLADVADLQRRGRAARAAIAQARLPDALRAEIATAYAQLSGDEVGGVDVAVRSSATAEDLPEASFAGQQESFLNVRGLAAVEATVLQCFASLFTDRAISYRAERGYPPLSVALSVGVQRMVRSDLASAGVIFTLDTESGHRDVVLVTGAWGLGESVVQGIVGPDEWTVFKPTLAQGFRPIVRRAIGSKETRMVYDPGGGRRTRTEPVSPADRARPCLTDDEVLALSQMAVRLEAHYSARRGMPTPLDIEWAKDGRTGALFIVQARPETVQSRRTEGARRYQLTGSGTVVARGRAVGEQIATGAVRVIRTVEELGTFRDGEVLVADRTDPDWEPVMRRAAAIVTDRGGRTCHAAIVSRELGVPAVVGAGDATLRLTTGQAVTVTCASGEEGRVYDGSIPFEVTEAAVAPVEPTATRVQLIVGNPSEAFRLAQLPSDGIGLCRIEFIVGSQVGIHPMALLAWPALPPPVRDAVAQRSAGWDHKPDFFVARLAEGVGALAAAFWPRPVIVRLSDFKSNEYAGLIGGAQYEPREENPMIGLRGAARYTDPRFRPAFDLECAAMRRVRDDWGLTNVHLMVPFCRTVGEADRVIAALAENGLPRGGHGLALYMMCEIPANVVQIDAFAQRFDGFSIGSNDLTQLTLGVDRDSADLATLFDERDPAVVWMIRHAIAGAHAAGRPIGICGQAPSDWPEFAQLLVDAGIDSISLNPDSLAAGRSRIHAAEAARAARG
jgi:pyruvate,water dikinase